MTIINFGPNINLIEVVPPITGFQGFLGIFAIKSDKIALIDVGPDSSLPDLFSAMRTLKIAPEKVDYILTTHIHLDHSGGMGRALQQMPGAVCIVHEKGLYHLVHPARLWEGSLQVLKEFATGYGEPLPVPENRLMAAREGMVIDLGGIQLEILLTPGHAPHHISFFDRKNGRLFVGEAAGIFYPVPGLSRPASPPPFDLRQALLSINKLIALNPREIYYNHFGYSLEATARLQKFKNQLLSWGQIISHNLEGDVMDILDEILTRDGTQKEFYSFSPDRMQCELHFIKNNIRGFKEYFQKEGTAALKELSLL